uniref:Uncharacterized protein n=1 Tax=Arundo donax TaxID=35708 RepID=A0A0A9DW31_ARUDO
MANRAFEFPILANYWLTKFASPAPLSAHFMRSQMVLYIGTLITKG